MIRLLSFYERLAEVRKGEKKEDKPRQRQKTLAYDLAVEWFRNFAKNADYMPNSSTRTLPSCLSKLAVYQLYKDEMGDRPVLDRSHFIYHMWKTEFPNVFIPKVSYLNDSLQMLKYQTTNSGIDSNLGSYRKVSKL